ncbi:MAG: dihydroorotate dehydrogenase electron transfer subunit [Candidatus Bathyarchaeia archaeon]
MSAYPTAINKLRTVKIREIMEETPTIKTFTFYDKLCSKAEPGQFAMIWIPGVDEIPISISAATREGAASITVEKVGYATEMLHKKGEGDVIGVRGPYGNYFKLEGGKAMLVGGGTGLIPLTFLAEKLARTKNIMTFLLGAKTKNELLFLDRIGRALSTAECKILVATEDGSHGVKGLVTDVAEQILRKEKFAMIYTCGPEKMMLKMFLLAESYGLPIQASFERLMRCAVGLCGQCVLGQFRVCRDGPVFSTEQLRQIREEFGIFKLGFDGRKVPL